MQDTEHIPSPRRPLIVGSNRRPRRQMLDSEGPDLQLRQSLTELLQPRNSCAMDGGEKSTNERDVQSAPLGGDRRRYLRIEPQAVQFGGNPFFAKLFDGRRERRYHQVIRAEVVAHG